MVYLAITAIIIIIIIKVISSSNNQSYMNKMLSVADLVERETYTHLSSTLESKHGEQKAQMISTAITNYLFSKSLDKDVKKFIKSHKGIINQEIFKIQYDRDLCKLITKAVSIRCIYYYSKKTKRKDLVFEPVMKLKKYKIYVELNRPPRFNEFLASVQRYFNDHNEKNFI